MLLLYIILINEIKRFIIGGELNGNRSHFLNLTLVVLRAISLDFGWTPIFLSFGGSLWQEKYIQMV